MKKSIKVALAGLLAIPALALSVAVFSPSSSLTYADDCSGSTGTIQSGADCAAGNESGNGQLFGNGSIFATITNTLLFLVGAISVIMLIYGGIRYTISGGDSSAVTAAKNTILYAIVGIIVALLAYAIVNFVLAKLGTSN
jgi:hypothetical protein